MTTPTVASRSPLEIASIIDCRLLPRPDTSTAIRGRSENGREVFFSLGIDFASSGSFKAYCMPRRLLTGTAGVIFHVINRGAKRDRLFDGPADYDAFENLLVASQKEV